MRVLLLYPNLYGMNMLPPAIGLFTALLRRDGHVVSLFDTTVYENMAPVDSDMQKAENLNARPYDDALLKQQALHTDPLADFRNHIQQFAPDLIAMSVTEDMYPIGITLLKNLGKMRPLVVAGGVFPTFAPDLALRYSEGCIDYVLKGEGDETLPQFCRSLEQGIDVSSVPGLHANLFGKLVDNPLPRPVDLTTLPLPDYDLFDESRFYRPMQGKLWRMLPVQTIRGCPYTCAYCNSPWQEEIHKKAGHKFFRKQRTDFIRDELRHCVEVYKADSFYFWADTFLAWNEMEFEEFCEMYSDFRLPFWIQTRPETVKAHRFKKLRDIGLLRVSFGVEHGNEAFRERILHRRVKNESIIANLKIVTDMGIPISVNNIIGFPTETRDLVFDTIELNRNFASDGINAYSFTPFHGTPLRQLSEELGFVKIGELSRSIMAPTMLDMPQFPREVIEGIRRCFVLYVKMPKTYWSEIARAERLTPEGDAIFKALKEKCRTNFMNYGDYAKEDDVEVVDLNLNGSASGLDFERNTKKPADFEAILRSHARKSPSGEQAIIWIK
jgi:anaerobic magnesium-protoporphyrin IX monomethyl ester cyclase